MKRGYLSLTLGLLLATACGTPNNNTDAATGDTGTSNDTGMTGDGGTICTPTTCPVVRQLSLGYRFSLALLEDGTVRCWGDNSSGQCGDGTTMVRERPVRTMGLTNVTQVAAGSDFACALKSDGTVWCWGSNGFGRLGDGTTNASTQPVQVMGVADATQIATGLVHACAVLRNGTTKCWGRGDSVGNATTNPNNTAVDVSMVTDATAVALSRPTTFGGSTGPASCVLRMGGTARCWGSNNEGFLGDNSTVPLSRTPVDVTGLTGATALVAGGAHACALVANGELRCWGMSLSYQLGVMSQDAVRMPMPGPSLTNVRQIAAGRDFTCAVMNDGTAQCWGSNSSGQLGRGMRAPIGEIGVATPAPVVGLAGIRTLSLGDSHGCAYTADGYTRCWGSSDTGQLGDGSGQSQYTPTPVAW